VALSLLATMALTLGAGIRWYWPWRPSLHRSAAAPPTSCDPDRRPAIAGP